MNKVEMNVVGVDVNKHDESVESFDAFIESLSSERTPISAMLDGLESKAAEN